MHDHQADLIMALAEGRLAGPEAEQARARLESCPDCLSELRAQRRALEAIREAPSVALTDLERTRLRQAVSSHIGVSRARRHTRPVPWGAVAVAAAALAAVAVAAPLLSGVRQGGSEGVTIGRTADEGAATLESESPAAVPSSAAGAEELQMDAPQGFQPQVRDLGKVEPASLREILEEVPTPDVTRAEAAELKPPDSAAALLPCFTEAQALSDQGILLLMAGEATFEEQGAVVYVYAAASESGPDAPLDSASLWVLAEADCRILQSQLSRRVSD